MFWNKLFRSGSAQETKSFTAAKHLKLVSTGNPDDFAGIVRVEILVSAATVAGSVLKASVVGQPDTVTELGSVAPDQTLSVGVHFHMTGGGAQQLVFELTEPNQLQALLTVDLNIGHETGFAQNTAQLMKDAKSPVFFLGPCDSKYYPYAQHTAWFDRPDADEHIQKLLTQGDINEVEAAKLRQFVQEGYLEIEGLIDEALVDAVNAEIDKAVAEGYQGYKYGTSKRIEHLHDHYPHIRQLWLDKRHRRYVGLIFDTAARPCQTLTYVFGSQQDAHQDLIHLTPVPAGYMCGTWIALQDVVPDSGELVVYPGSHRERRYYMTDFDCAKVEGSWAEFGRTVVTQFEKVKEDYEPVIYRPKKGSVLIWHENLLHAGSARIDKSLERRSIVIHSFADGAVAYYDSTGLNGSAVSRKTLDQGAALS